MNTTTCEQCGTAPGTQHTFHYGRVAAVSDQPEGLIYHASAYSSGHRGRFQIGGLEAVTLCNRCLLRARMRRARQMLRSWIGIPLVTAGYAVLVIGVFLWVITGAWTQAALWLGVGLVVTAVAFGAAYVRLRGEDFAQHTAVDVHLEKLRGQGWDKFWTDNEFAQLTPH